MEYLFIYLLQFVETLQGVTNIITGFAIFCTVALAVVWMCSIVECGECGECSECSECLKRACNSLKPIVITTVILSLLLRFVPTKQTLVLMGGLYLGKQTAKKIELDSKIDKINTIITLELDKRIKELSSASSNEH